MERVLERTVLLVFPCRVGTVAYLYVALVDQPAGTGYSYINTNSYVHELDAAAEYVVEFLRKFYLIFPEFETMDVSPILLYCG